MGGVLPSGTEETRRLPQYLTSGRLGERLLLVVVLKKPGTWETSLL